MKFRSPHLGIDRTYTAFGIGRIGEAEGAVRNIDQVASYITQRTGTEIPPASPPKRVHARCIGAVRCRAKPEVPVERIRFLGRIGFRHRKSLRPDRTVGPDLNIGDLSEYAGINPLLNKIQIGIGSSLISYLSYNTHLIREVGRCSGFVYIVGMWFLE